MPTPFVDFSGDNLPLNLIYSEVYSNVSGQVLEIDKSLVPAGHLWSRLFYTRVLIGDDYTNRGYITQVLIRQGLIAKAIYSPIIPQGYLFLQSYESDTWFEVDALEVDPDDTQPDTREDVSFISTEVTGPPAGTVINFNVEIPSSYWFILGLDDTYTVGMQLDTVNNPGDISFLYKKRLVQQNPSLPIPISIPNTSNLIFDDQDNNQFALKIDDDGQLFFTPYFGITPYILLNQNTNGDDSLFWQVVEPVLNEIPNRENVVVTLDSDILQASYSGSYRELSGSGYSGTVSFQWRLPDVADCIAGTFTGAYGTSADGLWSTSGTLSISGILEEPSWGPG